MAVGQVAAAGEVHAHQRVAGLEDGEVDRHVGLAAAVRLDVDVLGAEQLLGPLARQPLGVVDELAAAVVAPSGVALGVLVGHHRRRRLAHRGAGEVLRGDQLEAVVLAPDLGGDRLLDLRIGLCQATRAEHGGSSHGPRGGGGRLRLPRARGGLPQSCPAPPSSPVSFSAVAFLAAAFLAGAFLAAAFLAGAFLAAAFLAGAFLAGGLLGWGLLGRGLLGGGFLGRGFLGGGFLGRGLLGGGLLGRGLLGSGLLGRSLLGGGLGVGRLLGGGFLGGGLLGGRRRLLPALGALPRSRLGLGDLFGQPLLQPLLAPLPATSQLSVFFSHSVSAVEGGACPSGGSSVKERAATAAGCRASWAARSGACLPAA